ncbi:MAG: OmpA family protein [Planctomycetaceae bacterium]|nr:OmpA family protein [Planctomycetaceae bacterium]
MLKDMRSALFVAALPLLSGCNMAPAWQMRQAQLRTYQAYRQGEMYQAQATQAQQMASQLSQELGVANERLANLNAERSLLHEQYKGLLAGLPAPGSPLSQAMRDRLSDLAARYPQFEFDPISGVLHFEGDILFSSGSDVIRPEGMQILMEFAQIMNSPEAQSLHILVVGHTDDRPVVLPSTKAQHETNWELSAHRATRVVRALAGQGLSEPRMGIAGYNQYQPEVSNSDDHARQLNRRVEIYVLAPDTSLAGRELPARK